MSTAAITRSFLRNTGIVIVADLVIAVIVVAVINDPKSAWTIPAVVSALWITPWLFRLKAAIYHYVAYRFNERAQVIETLETDLRGKGFPVPGRHYDLAEDYFLEVATDDAAPLEARLAAARYLGADAAWAQTQQVQTRWLFNRAALEAIGRYRDSFVAPQPA